jgi:hypothetical protein
MTTTVPFTVRLELYNNLSDPRNSEGNYIGSLSCDLEAVALPRAGEYLSYAALGPLALGELGPGLLVDHVEHSPMPFFKDAPEDEPPFAVVVVHAKWAREMHARQVQEYANHPGWDVAHFPTSLGGTQPELSE